MERERGSKIIAIAALCVGVVGLSLGFAAFASQLTIKSSASVSPSASSFNVDFSTTEGTVNAGNVTGTATGTGATGGTATINNSGEDSTIQNLSATFTEPGQSVVYDFYAHNAGQYEAFLNSVTFANATGGSANKVCTPGSGTDNTMVQAACANISLTVKVGDDTFTGTQATVAASHALAAGTSEPVKVTIAYTGNKRADGDFSVNFGDVTLKYESVD